MLYRQMRTINFTIENWDIELHASAHSSIEALTKHMGIINDSFND